MEIVPYLQLLASAGVTGCTIALDFPIDAGVPSWRPHVFTVDALPTESFLQLRDSFLKLQFY